MAPSFAFGSTARRPRSRSSLSWACARTARRCCSRSRAWAARAPRPGALSSTISSSAGCAVDNEELGPPQPALDEIVEDSAPGLGALAAHALDREQHLLAVRAHAEDNEQRDGGRLAIEPHAHHGAVENEPHDRLLGQRAGVPGVPIALHLPPRPAHRVLADRAAKQGRKRAANPTRIYAGKVAADDQRIGRKCAALIGP